MWKASARLMAGAAFLALSGCAKKEAAPTINASMTDVMEPKAEVIWDTVSKAYNEIGDGLTADKLNADDWKAIAAASSALKTRAEILAKTDHIVVANANEPILGSQAVGIKGQIGPAWDAVNAQTVQSRIDARPDLFKEKARVLIDAADAILRASQTKDVALLYKVASDMDEVCDGCHEPFWGTDEPPAPPR